MKKYLLFLLQKLDLFDFLKIVKDKYFRFGSSKKEFKRKVNFYSQFIKRDSLCFDVGANYGNRTEAFLELGTKVVAIEPQPNACKFLMRRLRNKIFMENKALGQSEGTATLFLCNLDSLTSLTEEWIEVVSKSRFCKPNWHTQTEVYVATLDKLINKYGKPGFCKIDVEGYELEVIKGLSEPIDTISFEFTIPEFTEKAIMCINYLSKIGKIECNYSDGETLKLSLDEWFEPEEFIPKFKSLPLNGIIDGDIYVRFTSKIINES